MIRAFVKPVPAWLSRSIFRTGAALAAFAPSDVVIVDDYRQADLVVVHAIGWGSFEGIVDDKPGFTLSDAQRFAVLQYCYKTTENADPLLWWYRVWSRAACVWSYYDLAREVTTLLARADADVVSPRFYHAPLGADHAFVDAPAWNAPVKARDIGMVTTGYVGSPCGEPIAECAYACDELGLTVVHVGGKPEGMGRTTAAWTCVRDISDAELASLYQRSRWVAGMRYGEGFEMPAIEGALCGARPIIFNNHNLTRWHRDYAAIVSELQGDALVEQLVDVLRDAPRPFTLDERERIRTRYDWPMLVQGFWDQCLRGM